MQMPKGFIAVFFHLNNSLYCGWKTHLNAVLFGHEVLYDIVMLVYIHLVIVEFYEILWISFKLEKSWKSPKQIILWIYLIVLMFLIF